MENIWETLARNRLGHSPTLNRVERECSCGEHFTDTIYIRGDGSETKTTEKCPKCQNADMYLARKTEAEKKLKEVICLRECEWLEESNMPSLFALKTFETFDRKLQPKAYELIKAYNYHGDDEKDVPASSVVLLSPGLYGVGKTHLVCALINQICETETKAELEKDLYIRKYPCPIFFTSENVLLRRIRQTFSQGNAHSEETEENIYQKLSKYGLLIIDDVGKVRPRDVTFTQGVYFNIIDQRYSDGEPIILTTNLDYAELENHIGGACADRLREMCGTQGFVRMTGKSYRSKRGKNELPTAKE